MEKVLPDDEAGSIQWEGGSANVGDENEATPNPKDVALYTEEGAAGGETMTPVEAGQDAAQTVADSQAVEDKAEEDDDYF